MDKDNQQEASIPNQPSETVKSTPAGGLSKTVIILAAAVLVLLAGSAAAYVFTRKDTADPAADSSQSQQANQAAGGQDESNKAASAIDCEDSYTVFADKEFGAAFCYPSGWGTATVQDARIGADDTGHRQSVVFSDNQQFSVGGVSDDWTTTVGRGGGCLEPSNVVPELSSYNVEWHDITEDFAQRSMETSTGGYDMTETVGTFHNGLCATGHKVIDGSRYRVISASYFNGFTAEVATVDDHVYNAYELFRETQRFELDKLLSTLRAY